MVGFSITPAAGKGILTYLLCVSLVSLLKGNCVQDVSLFKIEQYHLALLNSPHEEAYEYLSGSALV